MNTLIKAEKTFVGVALIVATTVLFVNIVLRYLFSANTTWAEEFIRYVFIWIAFIGASICFRRGTHFAVDLLSSSVKAKGKRVLQLYINVASIIFLGLLVKFGMDLVLFSMNSGQITPSLEIKTFWIYLAIPLGSLLSIIHLLFNTYDVIKNKERASE